MTQHHLHFTLDFYQNLIKGATCKWCASRSAGRPAKEVSLEHLTIEHYEHDGGWPVKGYQQRRWLYVTCPKCDYQWSLWKLGVPRHIPMEPDQELTPKEEKQ
jgi:hypothetical protein